MVRLGGCKFLFMFRPLNQTVAKQTDKAESPTQIGTDTPQDSPLVGRLVPETKD